MGTAHNNMWGNVTGDSACRAQSIGPRREPGTAVQGSDVLHG